MLNELATLSGTATGAGRQQLNGGLAGQMAAIFRHPREKRG
ncbi:hypothetical protein [Pantoea sp. SGAir0180]